MQDEDNNNSSSNSPAATTGTRNKDNIDFATSTAKRVVQLQKENDSLRAELAQMRLVMMQVNKAPPISTQLHPASSSAAGLDTRKSGRSMLGGRARKERVKVAFNLMSVKHAAERLRNTVVEMRTGMQDDFNDAVNMMNEKRQSVDGRIANERPLVHRVHEAICELVRHGGNQKEKTLQHLFSATSWGFTHMSLTQAAGDIVEELHNLVAVAEQQRRAKEVLEVAAVHKDRCLERANVALIDMARTARDVVGKFANMARTLHNMAAQTEEVSHVRSLLVTRSLTLPDLDGFVAASKKSATLSTRAIEKFARHLQDSAFAATSLLSSATKAVLEPDTHTTTSTRSKNQNDDDGEGGGGGGGGEGEVCDANDSHDSEQQQQYQPGLISRLRKRWVKSVFERAMLRIRFRKCLSTIHDDFVLASAHNNNSAGVVATVVGTEEEEQEAEETKEETTTRKQQKPTRVIVDAPVTRSVFDPEQPGKSWTSSLQRPTAPYHHHHHQHTPSPSSSSSIARNDGGGNNTIMASGDGSDVKVDSKTMEPVPWSAHDDVRLALHEKRHRVRMQQALGVVGDDAVADVSMASKEFGGAGGGSNNSKFSQVVFSGIERKRRVVGPPSHLKPTALTARRNLPPPSAILGKMSPLTGSVEVAAASSSSHHDKSNINGTSMASSSSMMDASSITGQLRKKDPKMFLPSTLPRAELQRRTVGVASLMTGSQQPVQGANSNSNNNNNTNTASGSKFTNTNVRDTLREFFVLRDA